MRFTFYTKIFPFAVEGRQSIDVGSIICLFLCKILGGIIQLRVESSWDHINSDKDKCWGFS